MLLTKKDSGVRVKLREETVIHVEQTTQRNGSPELEVGGPGNGPFTVYFFDVKKDVSRVEAHQRRATRSRRIRGGG